MMILSQTTRSNLSLFLLTLFCLLSFVFYLEDLKAVNPSVSFANSQAQQPARQFVFKPGDAVEVSVYQDTTIVMKNIFPIDGYGNIYLPIMGKLKISAMSKSEFEGFLKQNYSQYLRVSMVNTRPLIKAGLIGGFSRPGFYYVDEGATLWELIALGQGIGMDKGLEKMKWRRNGKTMESNLTTLAQSGRPLRELGFRSGDQLVTPSERPRTFLQNFMPYFSLVVSLATLYLSYYYLSYRLAR